MIYVTSLSVYKRSRMYTLSQWGSDGDACPMVHCKTVNSCWVSRNVRNNQCYCMVGKKIFFCVRKNDCFPVEAMIL